MHNRGPELRGRLRENLARETLYTLKMTVVVASGGSRRAEPLCNRQSNHQSLVFVKGRLTASAALGCQQLLPTDLASVSAIMQAAVNLEVIKQAAAAWWRYGALLVVAPGA